jgi:hypothetical protein
MRVWVLTDEHEYHSEELIGVYLTEDAARTAADKFKADATGTLWIYSTETGVEYKFDKDEA